MNIQWINQTSRRLGIVSLLMGLWLPMVAFGQAQVAGQEGPIQSGDLGTSVLTIQGSTAHPTLLNAQLEINAGSAAAVSGSTDSDGRFEVEFNCSDPDGLVVVEVTGTGAQAHVGAARVLHSCDYLLAEADASGAFQIGPVTPLSTVVYAVLHWTLSDLGLSTQGMSYQDMAPLQQTLQLNESWRILAVLPFINNQDIDLPDGIENVLELVLDRVQLVAAQDIVFEQVPFERQQSVLQALVFSPVLFRNPDPPDDKQTWGRYCPSIASGCPSKYTIMTDLLGEYSFFMGGGPASFTFRARQDLIYQERWQTRTDNLQAIRVEREDGAPLDSRSFVIEIDGDQVEATDDTVWQDLRLANASELIELIAVAEKRVRRFPNSPEIPEQVFEPTGMGFLAGFSNRNRLPEWGVPAEGDTWILSFYFGDSTPERPTLFGHDRVTFSSDGSAFAHRQDIPLQWSLSDGQLILTGDDIDTHEYQILGGSKVIGGHEHVLISVRDESELTNLLDRSIVQADGPTEFVEANVPGRYVSGFDLDRLLPFNVKPIRFQVFQFNEDGTGWRASLEDVQQSNPENTSPFDWSLNDRGEIVIRREFSPDFVQWRNWTPVVEINGEDQYVLELGPAFISDDPDYEFPFAPGRLNFYRKVEVSEP